MSSKTRVGIIAGHRNSTYGKRTAPFIHDVDVDGDGDIDVKAGEQYKEHTANVGVCVLLNEALLRCGFDTFQVGWNDDDPTDDDLPDDLSGLTKRQRLIKEAKCEISVSVHFNAFGDGRTFNSAGGVCTFAHSSPTKCAYSFALAKIVQRHLVEGTKQQDRGARTDAFAEVNCQAMGTKASVLVELAFMTNEYEAEHLMANTLFWRECAEEICKAICEYTVRKYVEPEDVTMKITSITAKMNDKDTVLKSVVINDENYIRLRDLADAQTDDTLTVMWDELSQTVIIKSK